MTTVVDVRLLETCLDRTSTFEVRLDEPLSEAVMRRLATGARLDFHPEFPRPYFRIDRPTAWVAQGVLGNTCFRLTGSTHGANDPVRLLRDLIEKGDRETWESRSRSTSI